MLSMEEVVSNEIMGEPAERLRRLILRGKIAKKASPGQFVHIQVSSQFEPLLRRPLSISSLDPEKGEITVLYRIQGRGTEILSKVQAGERLSILGPLGNGFSLPVSGELWLVAGGIGSFPLFALAQKAIARGLPVRLFWGGTNHTFLKSAGLAEWRNLQITLDLTTLDGSLGKNGLVTDALKDAIRSHITNGIKNELVSMGVEQKGIRVAACGPLGMMQAVVEVCHESGIPLEVSLEENMACGVGACLGCAVMIKDAEGVRSRKKVCQDGPVFRGGEVVWNAAD